MDEQEQADFPTKVTSRSGPLARGGASVPPSGIALSGKPNDAPSLGGPNAAAPVSEAGTTTPAMSQESSPAGTLFSTSGPRPLGPVQSLDEAQETTATEGIRLLSGSMLCWCAAGVPMVIFTPGKLTDKIICGVGIFFVALGFGWQFFRALRRDAIRIDDLLPVSVMAAVAGQIIGLGAGLCSPYSGLIALTLAVYSTSAPFRHALAGYVMIAVTELGLGSLAAMGVVSSTGLLDPEVRSSSSVMLNVTWVELAYATAFAIGQVARRASASLMARFELAVREAAQRDALWREVRAELDRAAKLGGPGQFTGQLVGVYKLAEVIGRGGMGDVYAASRTTDGLDVAVKLLRREALSDTDVVARFEREASIVAKLKSPHVVMVHDIATRESIVPFIAMERLRGSDLAAELRNLGVLPARETVRLIREVAEGLEAAHAEGVVHRDLKPSNLFHAELPNGSRRWKILDFGVSKILFAEDATLTRNQLVGTPQYMSPEQAGGSRSIDHRTDIHALAAITYRALTGRMAFPSGDLAQVIVAVASEIPEDPRRHAAISDEVAYVLRLALAKRPEDRFESARAFSEALAHAFDGSLRPELRERAAKLESAEPWGGRALPVPR